MKYFFSILLTCSYFTVTAQSFTENDIKKIAQEVNTQMKGMELGNGITAKGCVAYNRTLVYQHDVDEFWYPPVKIKDELIANFKEAGNAKIFFKNNIDADFNYYFGNKLKTKVSIKSTEFSNLNFDLGEYISINGHPKAKGVNLKIRQPIGWKIEEGERPNIVKKFTFETNSFLILIVDNIMFVSKNEAKELFEEESNVESLINEFSTAFIDPKIIGHRIITIDRFPVLEFTITGYKEQFGNTFMVIVKSWLIYYEDKQVYLMASAASEEDFNAYEGLYNLISNSLIFPDQYSK